MSQLTGGAQYTSLAAEFAELQTRVLPSLVAVDLAAAPDLPQRVAGFRWKDDLVLIAMPTASVAQLRDDVTVQAVDRGNGLALVRLAGQAPSSPPAQWVPQRAQPPRYLATTDVAISDGTPGGVSLRPAFIGSFVPTGSSVWPGTVWAIPSGSPVTPGSFVFTTTGDFVGLAEERDGQRAIVPGPTVLAEAERLLRTTPGVVGRLGLEVQALTEAIASLTGASAGVIVVWVEAKGPAGGTFMVGDVIEAVGGNDLQSRAEWDALVARLESGDTLSVRIRRDGQVHELSVRAAPVETEGPHSGLGVGLRRRVGVGTEVLRVDEASAASRAGLSVGDVITLFGDVHTPTPQQVMRSFAALRPGDRVMVAVTRGDAHHVTVLAR